MVEVADKKSGDNYKHITRYEGLFGIRAKLAMYVGSTGVFSPDHMPRALLQMFQETISNSFDEFVMGYGKLVRAIINEDNSMTIVDQGRGIPKGPNETFDDVIGACTKHHASGKFDDDAYAALGVAGMHGIGLKAVNAGSSKMAVEVIARRTKINDEGEIVHMRGYEHYIVEFKQDEVLRAEILERFSELPEGVTTGTSITFWPDGGPISEDILEPVLASTDWKVNDMKPRLESSAVFQQGLKIVLEDRRLPEDDPNRVFEWQYDNGVADYIMQLADGQELIDKMPEPIVVKEDVEYNGLKFALNCAMIFTEDIGTSIVSFANGVPTKDGGPHYDGFVASLVKSVNSYAKDKRLIKKPLTESDVLDGLTAVFEFRVPAKIAAFEGQTKEKLGTAEARPAIQKILDKFLLDWLYDNADIAEEIIKKMTIAADSRAAAVQARREAQKARQSKSKGIDFTVSSKLKAASSKNPAEKELYITEGDSASNIGRDKKTQAVFPIRGKIKNAYKSSLSEALANTEISTITSVIGAGIGQEFNVDDMQYHKIIIASDKDSDGAHICMLLLGIFSKFFPGLVASGRLYVAVPPLYKAVKYVKGKPQTYKFYNEAEMDAARSKLQGYEISRYKGLGEMNLDDIHEAIADPKTRRLTKVTQGDVVAARKALKIMLGDDSDLRKTWIAENIDFENAEV